MALRIDVDNEDLTRSRFAISPLWELSHALRLLAKPPDASVLRPWLVRARDRYQALAREADIGVILALLPPGYGAALLEPEWPALRAILERDVVYRAGQLTSRGWAAALSDLHPDLAWERGQIVLNRMTYEQDAALGGRGLLFVPSVFIWPKLALGLDPPWPPALIYPARGVAALWERPGRVRSGPAGAATALDRLLGASRAAILVALEEPASTTLAFRFSRAGVQASAVGAFRLAVRWLAIYRGDIGDSPVLCYGGHDGIGIQRARRGRRSRGDGSAAARSLCGWPADAGRAERAPGSDVRGQDQGRPQHRDARPTARGTAVRRCTGRGLQQYSLAGTDGAL